jgi:hypothetical protein
MGTNGSFSLTKQKVIIIKSSVGVYLVSSVSDISFVMVNLLTESEELVNDAKLEYADDINI